MIAQGWNVRDVTTPETPETQPDDKAFHAKAGTFVACLVLAAIALNIASSCNDDDPEDPASSSASTASSPAGGSLDLDRCGTNRDVLVWQLAPGQSPTADRLGEYDVRTCQSTFDYLRETVELGQGFCTEAGYASDNPGYDESARPAWRLSVVEFRAGLGCWND